MTNKNEIEASQIINKIDFELSKMSLSTIEDVLLGIKYRFRKSIKDGVVIEDYSMGFQNYNKLLKTSLKLFSKTNKEGVSVLAKIAFERCNENVHTLGDFIFFKLNAALSRGFD
jgi:hypothetical protein